MNSLEKKIFQKIKDKGPLDFPGLKISALYRGKKIMDMSFGKTWEYYDIASLTKIVFTTSAFMKLQGKRKNLLSSKVQEILPWYKYSDVEVRQLLSHCAGYEWWRPFYRSLTLQHQPEEKFNQLMREVRKVPLAHRGRKAVYSDIDFFLLGALLEKIYERPLIKVWEQFHRESFPQLKFHFNYDHKLKEKKSSYAPTEKCPWRGKVLQGEVHDDNTWALGGIAPHAGLFARMKDMLEWGKIIRAAFKGQKGFVASSVIRKFAQRSMPVKKGDWGLGFMLPSMQNSSAGNLFSKNSFGHTGFTGTSFWLDPKRDLIINILSNRVYKSRKNKDFISLRPQIHDWVVEAIER